MGKWCMEAATIFPLRGDRHIWKTHKTKLSKYLCYFKLEFMNKVSSHAVLLVCLLTPTGCICGKHRRSVCKRISLMCQSTGRSINHETGLLSCDRTANRTWRSLFHSSFNKYTSVQLAYLR